MGLDSLQVDIAGLAETNLDWNNFENKNNCANIFRNYWKQTKIGMVSSNHRTNQFYQPGGVAMITGFPWASRSKTYLDESGLGRWTESELTGRCNRKVTIICAYMVCKDSIERSGPNTAYTQQWRILKEQQPQLDPDPRTIVFEDLKKRITDIRQQGHEVIVLMDANDTLQNTRSALTKWTLETNLIDPLVQRHGTEGEPPTHARGSQRIDYILVSEHISEYVTACGILPLHSICFSDHRALFLDIDLQAFLQSEPPSNMSRVSRGISSEDPRSVKKYQENLLKALNSHDFESMLNEVDKNIAIHGPIDSVHEMIELIDKKFTQVRLDCEKESQSKHRHPWSPALRDASHANHYWNIWLSQVRQNKDFWHSRQRFVTQETVEYEMESTYTIQFIKFKLSQAQKRLHNVHQRAEELRQIFLEDKAKMYSEEGNQPMESILRRIIYHEQKLRIFRKLKWIQGKTMSGGLDYIIQTDEDGQEYRIQDPDDIFSTIIQHNIKHFSQADATEFTREPLKSILGTSGTNSTCDAILNGQFHIEEVDCSNAAKAILKQLKRTTNSEIHDEITPNNVARGYRKWGEFTSTSPSGLHLSHDRAVLRYMHSQQEIAEATDSPTLCDRVFGIKARLLQLAVNHGHVYQRWTKVVNAMIEKIPGKPLINKLRVIHLIESDFNLLIGILWGRRLVSHGERLDLFDDGQGGSRPDRRTQELLIQKHLVYSVWRLAKINGTSFDNDAKSCFDRIVMPLASIASQQVGMTKRACNLFLNTLQQMQYHIKTTAGTSEASYSTTENYTIHGPGQGGRGSPSVWLVVSSLIMKTMKSEQAKGSYLTNPQRSMETTQLMTGFVDDITHWYSSMDPLESTQQIERQMTYTAQLWTHLLSTTGGKLELPKCFSYLVSWLFDHEGIPRMATPEEVSLNIVLQDSESLQTFNITQKNSSEAHKTLGVMECPNGNYKEEFKRLMSKAKGFAQILATTKLTRYEAHTLYFTTFIPSMIYSAAIGTLTIEQAEQIQGSVTQQFAAKMGFNRCLPSAITYGPPSLGGVGLRHLFREQGTEKTMFIIRLLRTDRPASKILRIQLAWAQHVSGLSDPILENTWTPLPYLENELWISTLRHFLAESRLKLKILNTTTKEPKCQHDFFLMDAAGSMKYSDRKLSMINRCRVYLKVETIADVSSYSGKSIDTNALECNDQARIMSPALWPFQPRPGPKHIKVWQQFLQSFCHIGTNTLETPLGKWTCSDIPKREGCTSFFHSGEKRAVRTSSSQWEITDITERRTYKTLGSFEPHELLEGAQIIPADILELNGKQTIEWREIVQQAETQDTPNTGHSWESYIQSIPDWENNLIRNIDWYLPVETVLSILQNENKEVLIVSDGGCSGNDGAFGWVIANQLLTMIEGHGTAPGAPMSSHRAEAFGKISWIILLHHITLFHGIVIKCIIRSYCDNKAIVDATKTSDLYESLYLAMCPNFDVLRSIAIKQQQLTASTTNYENTKHVKAHQDQKKGDAELTREERLNIRADELATNALQKVSGDDTRFMVLPHGMAYLSLDDQVQSSGEHMTLRWRLSEFKLQAYYSDKFEIKIQNLKIINWAALRIAREKLSPGQRTFSIKHAIGWLATGSRMQMQGRTLCSCTQCGEEEDTDHLYRCPSKAEMIPLIAQAFKKFLTEIHTVETISDAMANGFQEWAMNQDCNRLTSDADISTAYRTQHNIGWHLFVRGFAAVNWSELQETRSTNPDKCMGDVWCSKICLWWIQKSHELWIERNARLHDTDKNKDTWKDKEVREQVRLLYDSAKHMDANDRRIFNVPLETKLTNTTESLQAWVDTMGPIVKICIQKQETRIRHQHKDIRSYFQHTQNTNLTEDTSTEETYPTNDHDDDFTHQENSHTTITSQPITNNPRIQTENSFYLLHSSGEMDPPDRVETPRAGDTDRAASHLRVG